MKDLIAEYQSITLKIINLQEKIDSIYYAAMSPGCKIITDMPMAPGFSGGGLEKVFIQIEKLTDRKSKFENERNQVCAAITAKLDQFGIVGIDRKVFWYREVEGKKWREISALTGYSISQLHRIFKKAIYTTLLL